MRAIKRNNREYAPETYKGYTITFSVTSYSVLVKAIKGDREFHSLKKFKSQALTDVKRKINKAED